MKFETAMIGKQVMKLIEAVKCYNMRVNAVHRFFAKQKYLQF